MDGTTRGGGMANGGVVANGETIEVMAKTSALEMGLALARALRALESKLGDALDEVKLDQIIAQLDSRVAAERRASAKLDGPQPASLSAAAVPGGGGAGGGGTTILLPFTFRLMCNGGGDGGGGE